MISCRSWLVSGMSSGFVDEAVVVAQCAAQLGENGTIGFCCVAEAGLELPDGEIY